MTFSLEYFFLYVAAGLVVGFLASGEKAIGLIGVVVAGILGAKFGAEYALLSGIEFGFGFFVGAACSKKFK